MSNPFAHHIASATPRRLLWPLLLALVGLGACVSSGRKLADMGGPERPAAFEDIALEAENLNWSDMVVSVRCGTLRRRLGMVPSNTNAEFTIPASVAACGGQVHFEADPVGSEEVVASPTVVLSGGETWVWRIAVQPHLSTLRIR